MPLFISDEELRRSDVTAVVGKAEEYVGDLVVQIETQKARADAAVINAEQTCALVEQKYVALLAQVSQLEDDKAQLVLSLEAKSSEHAQAQAQIHQLELQLMQREGEQGRQSCELQELQQARKELLDVVEKKNLELDEKNATSRTYLERILALTEERSNLESRIHEQMGEVSRLRALEARLLQEKEITSQHNSWLNQELQAKVSSLLEERQRNANVEAELQARIAEAERSNREKEDAYRRSQDRVKELEAELHGMIEELRFVKEDVAAKEEHLSTEVATASKLADLYKKSSDEWSRKVNDLEGVIKALEVHLNQTTSEFEGKLRQEVEAREAREKEFLEAKENFERKTLELQQTKNSDSGFLQIESRSDDPATQLHENAITLPNFPYGVSGTALAATLLRDGWTLGTVYSKYQEAVDAWRHERHERNRSQALLEKVLREIESKGARIMEERAEYTKMLDSYVIMEEKLNLSLSDQAHLENAVRDSKAELRRKERELKGALKDVSDLQTQVSILLKECMDIQKRHGIGEDAAAESCLITTRVPDMNSSDALISEKLVSFKDIHGMVEHNTQLRALLRVLAEENERKDTEMKEEFESRLQLRINEAADKVHLVLKRAEEQNAVIERLQGTVGMFKRLYEEERMRSMSAITSGPDIIERDSRRQLEVSQDELRRQLKDATDQIRRLEEELSESRHKLVAARGDSGRAEAEAAFAKEKLSSLTRESENQRKQMEVILQKNMEASQTITEYQRRLRENYQSVQNAEEQARKLSIQVSFLEREKELLLSAEQRSALEVSQLSDRVHRLQATLDTIETAAEVREVSRAEERRKLEKDMNRMQKEWVDAKHQLELERNLGRQITTERDKAVERIESLSLESKAALAALSASELRAKVAETRCGELEANLKRADEKIMVALAGGKKVLGSEETDTEILSTLQQSREEIEFLREELKASKMHAEQYKLIANATEDALKKMEEGHLRSKEEAAKTKDVTDSELKLLQTYLADVETKSLEKEKETGLLQASREALLRDTLIEVATLKEAEASKQVVIQQAEECIAVLREDVEKQHKQWRQAQDNYERQVMLQAETLRELSLVNEKAASLELEEIKLRTRVDKAEAELESVKVAFYMEKSALQASTVELEKRLEDLDSQNHLLLDRLEAKHINLAEQERKASGTGSGENNEESTLQSVIHYLRRAKEGAETEVSLLKQERTRLSKQFEAASRAAEEAQEKLRCHHETIRASIFTDEEFRALQSQIMEMNLLREKHGEVREENKNLAEENKGIRERLGKLQEEHEIVKRSVREKHAELEANGGEIQTLKTEVRRWQQRVTQVVQKYKSLDVDDYERIKVSLVEVQERVKQFENELELARKDAAESRESMLKHEQEASMKTENLAELERRLQEALLSEVSAKAELEKFRKMNAQYKRKFELASREKESISKELEDHKAGKKFVLEAVHQEALEASRKEAATRVEESLRDTARSEQTLRELDQRMTEKEVRIQSLEKALEKERDEKNKEKGKREKDRKTYLENAAKCSADINALKQERNSLKQEVNSREQELNSLKQQVSNLQQEKEQLMAGIDPARSDPTPTNAEADDQSAELPLRSEGELRLTNTAVSEPVLPPAVEVPVTGALSIMKPPPLKRITGPPSTSDAAEKEREIQELRASISEKERFQTRRSGRRLVRPRIEPSSQADSAVEAAEPLVDMSAEGTVEADAEAPKVSDTAEMDNMPSHKRSSSESMEPDQSAMNQDANVPPQKRARSNNIVETQDVGTPETLEPQEKETVDEEQKPVEFSFDNDDADPAKRVRFSTAEYEELVYGRVRPSTSAAPAEVTVEDMLPAEDAAAAAGTDNLEGEVTEADAQGDEMQTDQGEGAMTDTEDFVVDVEDGEIGTGEELEVEQEAQGDEKQEQLAKDVTNPAPEAQPEETCDAQLVEASGSGVDVASSTMDTEKVTEKAGGEAASSAPPAASASAVAAPPSSTTINLTDRARERAAQRRSMYQSPPSPRSRIRGRGRVLRGRGGGRT